METYNNITIIKYLQNNGVSLFTLADFARLFNIKNQQTLYKKIQRLEQKEIIKKLIKGKYLFLLNRPSEFMIANFLYQPSYISLESALSFHGMLPQFTYRITSVAVKKSKKFTLGQKQYLYSQIKQNLFWGYEKKEDFLIADKEKTLLDYLYFVFKGWRISNLNKLKSELDLSEINKKRLTKYFRLIQNSSFSKFLRKIEL